MAKSVNLPSSPGKFSSQIQTLVMMPPAPLVRIVRLLLSMCKSFVLVNAGLIFIHAFLVGISKYPLRWHGCDVEASRSWKSASLSQGLNNLTKPKAKQYLRLWEREIKKCPFIKLSAKLFMVWQLVPHSTGHNFFSQNYRPRNMLLQATLVISSFYKEKKTRKQVDITILCISCRKMV